MVEPENAIPETLKTVEILSVASNQVAPPSVERETPP
jgi:hypothetical protein